MIPPTQTILRSTLLAGAVLLASLLVAGAAMPLVLRLLLPAAVALLVSLGLARAGRIGENTLAVSEARALAAEARVADLTHEAAEMRHDLRGILSPALLTADRLAMSQDPASKRAGEAMISTVDRAEERLRRN